MKPTGIRVLIAFEFILEIAHGLKAVTAFLMTVSRTAWTFRGSKPVNASNKAGLPHGFWMYFYGKAGFECLGVSFPLVLPSLKTRTN